mmetsp:Transcript_107829/g.305035  ORF Transcript_107829/g.305035 Transcript_107829/m.305035 type:complete len:215 (-) Transcript_107829:237-881(-)
MPSGGPHPTAAGAPPPRCPCRAASLQRSICYHLAAASPARSAYHRRAVKCPPRQCPGQLMVALLQRGSAGDPRRRTGSRAAGPGRGRPRRRPTVLPQAMASRRAALASPRGAPPPEASSRRPRRRRRRRRSALALPQTRPRGPAGSPARNAPPWARGPQQRHCPQGKPLRLRLQRPHRWLCSARAVERHRRTQSSARRRLFYCHPPPAMRGSRP